MVEMSNHALSINGTIVGQTADQPTFQSGLSQLEALFAEVETVEVGQKFLRLQLGFETALLPVDRIAAVLTVEAKSVLPVPHMPDCVLGIYNWRGEVLWLLNFASQVGLDSLVEQPPLLSTVKLSTSFMVIVLQTDGQTIGLAVPEVYDIEQHDANLFQPPLQELFSPQLLPFVKGYFTGKTRSGESQRSTVLEVATILQDPRLRLHELN